MKQEIADLGMVQIDAVSGCRLRFVLAPSPATGENSEIALLPGRRRPG